MLRELDYRQSVETMSKDLKELGVSFDIASKRVQIQNTKKK